jgi:hypothetical protein
MKHFREAATKTRIESLPTSRFPTVMTLSLFLWRLYENVSCYLGIIGLRSWFHIHVSILEVVVRTRRYEAAIVHCLSPPNGWSDRGSVSTFVLLPLLYSHPLRFLLPPPNNWPNDYTTFMMNLLRRLSPLRTTKLGTMMRTTNAWGSISVTRYGFSRPDSGGSGGQEVLRPIHAIRHSWNVMGLRTALRPFFLRRTKKSK